MRHLLDLIFYIVEDCLSRFPVRDQELLDHLGELEHRGDEKVLARQDGSNGMRGEDLIRRRSLLGPKPLEVLREPVEPFFQLPSVRAAPLA